MKPVALAAAAVVIAGAILAIDWWKSSRGPGDTIAVAMPQTLSADAAAGRALFAANCAQCHGANAGGTDKGPPLIHKIYEPNHHPDQAFFIAAKLGVRSHHWPFGNMAPVPGVSEEDVAKIVAFVREVQRANGID